MTVELKTMEGLGAKVEEICQKVAQNKEKKNGCWEKNSIIKRSVQQSQHLNKQPLWRKERENNGGIIQEVMQENFPE